MNYYNKNYVKLMILASKNKKIIDSYERFKDYYNLKIIDVIDDNTYRNRTQSDRLIKVKMSDMMTYYIHTKDGKRDKSFDVKNQVGATIKLNEDDFLYAMMYVVIKTAEEYSNDIVIDVPNFKF